MTDKIIDLRGKFRDAFTGWLEIEEARVRQMIAERRSPLPVES